MQRCLGSSAWHFATPPWLRGGHAQTLYPAWYGRRSAYLPLTWQRERWTTPDDDFIDLDWLVPEAEPLRTEHKTTLVLFHGLEGGSSSHYAKTLAHAANSRGWSFVLPHFRACSGYINQAPRAYHSGDWEEIDWILRRLRAALPAPARLYAVGVSLGGNALLRWAQEAGGQAAQWTDALAALSAPLDLAAAGAAIDSGWNRHTYARLFLHSMKRKARQKWEQYPGLFDLRRACAATSLREFDDAFTAPLHGFAGVDDYWGRASAKPGMRAIKLPSLVLNANNDPLVPAHSLPMVHAASSWVTLAQPPEGGHVGFAACAHGRGLGNVDMLAMPNKLCSWLQAASH